MGSEVHGKMLYFILFCGIIVSNPSRLLYGIYVNIDIIEHHEVDKTTLYYYDHDVGRRQNHIIFSLLGQYFVV